MVTVPPASPHASAAPLRDRPIVVALAGMAALAAAMGIGRFAFTPLLPMMLHDRVIDLAGGSWLATANYVGYLLGALACMALPWWGRRGGRVLGAAVLARSGLVATALLALGMALPWSAGWPALRLAAGIASAVVFVNVSGWCMVRLVALARPAMGGMIFCGPGIGITLSGLSAGAMVAMDWRAAAGWVAFGLLAAVLCGLVWPVVQGAAAARPAGATAAPASARAASPAQRAERALLTAAYGLAGLGYIVTATFLPVIARSVLPAGSPWPDWFWPMFGAGVALGALLSTRTPAHWDRRWLLAGCYAVQAGAIGIGLCWPGTPGFAAGSLLLGLPFTAITFYALQEARRIWPAAGDSFTGLLTAAYGIGQIAGPPMVALLLHRSATPAEGFDWALEAAAAALVLGIVLYGAMARRWPLRRN